MGNSLTDSLLPIATEHDTVDGRTHLGLLDPLLGHCQLCGERLCLRRDQRGQFALAVAQPLADFHLLGH